MTPISKFYVSENVSSHADSSRNGKTAHAKPSACERHPDLMLRFTAHT
jgi:hypothetical protein